MKKIKVLKKVLNQLFYVLEPRHRRKMPRLFVCVFLTSLFELMGVTAVLPFVYALVDAETVMNNRFAAPILGYFHISEYMSLFVFLGVILIILYVVKNAFLMFSLWYELSFSTRIQKELTLKMLHSYLSRPYEFFLDCTTGEIARGCEQDTKAVYATIQNILNLTMSLLTTVLIGAYMIISDIVIALGTLVVALVAVFIMTKLLKPLMTRLSKKSIETSRKKNDAFNQTLYGIKELYVMGRQNMFIDAYDEACESQRRIDIKKTVIDALPNRLTESLFITGFVGVVLFRLSLGGAPASYVPKLASFAVGAIKVLPYIGGITNKINALIYQKPFINEAYQNIKSAEIYKKEQEEYAAKRGNIKLYLEDTGNVQFLDKIEVKNVQWKYSKGKTEVLSNANLSIKRGESIGLIGKSGSGKTTISDIILGLLKPQQGSVFMDGIDIFTMPKVWSRIVGYVPQSVFLLAGTIRDNVAFGMKNLKDEDVWESLDKAQLKDFVETLPEGIDTYVGERGVKLSGGQRQRVAIARALANKPDVLVLDEATSALDNETETAIMESIESLQGQITMIIVAHRLTTIKKCDRIYKIEEGLAQEVSFESIFG